ncbi:MAG: hydrogenase iron-sulfur subunit [Anaerolineales bacterium]
MYEPKIVAFLCTWCSYTGADTAGIARLKSPANIRAVRVPCSGRVSPELILRAFDGGADGVLVLGCHIGECHYDTGNHRAAKRIPILKSLLSFAGLEPERLRLDWVSASEGERFARITNEFAEAVRPLGPARWRQASVVSQQLSVIRERLAAVEASAGETDCAAKAEAIQARARELLASGEYGCVIGYEVGPRGRTRPAFIYDADDVGRLTWNPDCTHNLTTYLADKVSLSGALMAVHRKEPPKPVAVVVKPCDARTVNVMLAENRFPRQMVHLIGVVCEGVRDRDGRLQARCAACEERVPVVYDTLIGEAPASNVERQTSNVLESVEALEKLPPAERMEYWLAQFDRCIRCYACRQACPLCDCPTCLFERDDSLWVGLGIGLNEKRTFHLGRAYHLAGRCVGCNQCEEACPMDIPISLLNQKLAQEIARAFGHRAGQAVIPSPVVTVLSGEYKED